MNLVIFFLHRQVAPEVLQSCVSTLLPILTAVRDVITTRLVERLLNEIAFVIRKGRCHMRHIISYILLGASQYVKLSCEERVKRYYGTPSSM